MSKVVHDLHETLITEARWHALPAERVERRVLRLLCTLPVPVSQVSASLRGCRSLCGLPLCTTAPNRFRQGAAIR